MAGSKLGSLTQLNGEARTCDVLVRNATVITVDPGRRIFSPGAIAIENGRILDVGDDSVVGTRYQAVREHDAQGGLVHPGFIEPLIHVSRHIVRETFDDEYETSKTLTKYIAAMNLISSEDEFASALLAGADMLCSGVTTFADGGAVFDADAVARAVEITGMRALLADPFLWDLDEFSWSSRVKRVPCDHASAIGRMGSQLWRNETDGLVRGYIALWGLSTASDALQLAAKACADDNGVALTQHQSLKQADVQRDDARLGVAPLVHYSRIGFLGPNVSLSHMNYLGTEELDVLRGTGTSVIWCPGNYFFRALPTQTISPIPHLLARDVNIALGTDTARAWGFGDQPMLGFLVLRADGELIPAQKLLDMVTIDAAEAIGLSDEIGSIEPNKLADIVVRQPQVSEMDPGMHPVRSLLGLRSKGVDLVIVNGQIVVEDGHVTRFDENEVFHVSRERARALMDRVARRVVGSIDPHRGAEGGKVLCPDPVDCLVAHPGAPMRCGVGRNRRVAVYGESALEELGSPQLPQGIGDDSVHLAIHIEVPGRSDGHRGDSLVRVAVSATR